MLEAPTPDNELDRLNALLSFKILDTASEDLYDEITKVASMITKSPISLISLIDKHRQWFKSKVGLDANETPRDISFCGHAIQQDEIFIVENSQQDSRFADNPLVTGEPHVIFYAGVPLKTSAGFNIGTLCVIDSKPKKLSEEQIAALKTFSKLVVSYLEMDYQKKVTKSLHEAIQKSAVKIQTSAEELARNSKFTALGEMAGGFAHEINNPLAIIHGNAFMIKSKIENKNLNEEKLLHYINTILQATERCVKIVKGIQQFAQKAEKDPFYVVNLLSIIQKSIQLAQDTKNMNDIKIDILNVDANIDIECRESKFCEVFVHLILNSVDAIENLNNKWIKIEVNVKNEEVEIAITDSGEGIKDENTLSHLMQPFFTTKGVGNGVGLGLCIVKGIIHDHKGLFIYNKEFPNTQFVIKIPKTHCKIPSFE